MNKYLVSTLIVVVFSFAVKAIALPWYLSDDLKKVLSSDRFGDFKKVLSSEINSADDLDRLLRAVGSLATWKYLRADRDSLGVVIDGEIAELLVDIKFDINTVFFDKKLLQIKRKFFNRVDTPLLREDVKKEIAKMFYDAGFLGAKIQASEVNSVTHGVVYKFKLSEGRPAVVTEIKIPNEKFISFDVKEGDYCNRLIIKEEFETLKSSLLNYRHNSLKLDRIKFSKDGFYCSINITGSLGKKVKYDIVDVSRGVLHDFFGIRDASSLDLKHSSPKVLYHDLISFYQDLGYEDVQIDGPRRIDGVDETKVQFHINPGKRYNFGDVQFVGFNKFAEDDLQSWFKQNWVFDFAQVFSRSKLLSKVSIIEQKYIDSGYQDIKIVSNWVRDSQKNIINVQLKAEEGALYLFDKIKVTGYNEKYADEVLALKLDELSENKVFIYKFLLEYKQKLIEFYRANGYLSAKVEIKLNFEKKLGFFAVSAALVINEGRKKKIRTIKLDGLNKTKPGLVLKYLKFKEGDWYDPLALHRSKEALISLGVFSDVRISEVNDPLEEDFLQEYLDIVVHLHEGNSGQMLFGPGYSLRHGANYVFEFHNYNLWGTGRRFSFKLGVSQEKQQKSISHNASKSGETFIGRRVSLGFVEPFFLSLPFHGKVSLSHIGRADQIWSLSNILELSFLYGRSILLKDSEWTLFYNYRDNNEIAAPSHEKSLVSIGDSVIGSAGVRFKWSGLDEVSWPSYGALLSGELSFARTYLGGDFNYFFWEGAVSYYYSLFSDFIWAQHFSLAAFENIERHNFAHSLLPSAVRLKAGGVNFVRGFFDELGPVVSKDEEKFDVLGGSRRLVIKTELRRRISENWASSVFLDLGNVFISSAELDGFRDSLGEYKVFDNNHYAFSDILSKPELLFEKSFVSYGVSLSYITPIGPINAHFSWPLAEPKESFFKRNKNKKFRFELNIGTQF